MKVKVKYSDILNKAIDIINSSKSKLAIENGFGVCVGFDIITSYLEDIAKRALKINDAPILESFINLGILVCDSEEEKEDIIKRAKLEEK